jgi:AcrR family transcriptional regulator
MMQAMARAMAEKGFVATSVADVVERAGVSRETFYQQFGSKLDCFMATFDAAGDVLFRQLEEIVGGVDRAGPPEERFERAFTLYLETLASQPAFARVFTVEVFAAGPEAIARRAALHERLAVALADLLDAADPAASFACEVLVAGVSTMVTVPLVEGDLDAIRSLRRPVVGLVRRAITG